MLDLQALSAAVLELKPFRWAHVDHAFPSRQVAVELARSVPRGRFEWTGGAGNRYRMANRTLVDRGQAPAGALDDLSAAWRSLVAQLASPSYRAALEDLTGCALGDAELQARLCRYGPGCWFDPHTDRPDKVVTHIVYLNELWDASWGGDLRILRSARGDDVQRTLAPVLDSAAVLVRSDASWHAVAPVAATAGTAAERVTLLVHLTSPG